MTLQNLKHLQTKDLASAKTRNLGASDPSTPTEAGGQRNERKGPTSQFLTAENNDDPFPESDDDDETETSAHHDDIINSWIPRKGKVENRNLYEDKYVRSRTKVNDRSQNLIQSLVLRLKHARNVKRWTGSLPTSAKDYLQEIILEQPDKFPISETANSQPDLLFLAFDLILPDSTRRALEAQLPHSKPCESCPLSGLPKALREKCLVNRDTRSTDAAVSLDSTIIVKFASDSDQGCLHGQVDPEKVLCQEKQLREGLQKILKRAETAREVLGLLLDARRLDSGSKDPQLIRFPSFQSILNLSPDETFTQPTSHGYNLLGQAVGLFANASLEYKLLLDVIEALVRRSPASIFYHNKKGTNAYYLLAELIKSKPNIPAAKPWMEAARDLIKKECIGYKGLVAGIKDPNEMWAKKKEVLYWDGGTEKKLCLNLAGESVIIDADYVEMITSKSGMRLETVLEFVRLPYWYPANAKRYQSKREGNPNYDAPQQPLEPFPDPYIGIFDWLWDKCKVRKIFTLDVGDDGPEPHTNCGIRSCLKTGCDGKSVRDFAIEVWKWRKYDICVDTIVTVAPKVREVHLFSSGNIAVLRGWSCRAGLAKLSELERLVVFIKPTNLNDAQDCRDYGDIFKARVAKHSIRLTEGNIDFEVDDQFQQSKSADGTAQALSGMELAMTSNTLSGSMPKREEWIEELFNFKFFISNLNFTGEEPKVKVAILDDGAKLADLNGVQQGWTFRLDNAEYFVGPCEHGTEMAVCIRDVCPMAELYIARLDDSRIREPRQKFTIASCTKALRWALDQGVDVISMSWTYEMTAKDTEKAEFEDAIRDAMARDKTIFFGSLPDLGPIKLATQFSPVGLPGVIKISSATRSGNVSEDNRHQNSDFLLPGDEIRDSQNEEARGSSFATAYATGLAALIIYTFKALEKIGDNSELASEALKVARKAAGMKRIFEILADGGVKQNNFHAGNVGPFVRPSHILGARKLGGTDAEVERDLLTIVNNLVPLHVRRDLVPGAGPTSPG